MPGIPGAERPLVQWLLVAMCVLIIALAALLMQRERAAERSIRDLRQQLDAATQRQVDLDRRIAREQSAREAFQLGLERERSARAPGPAIALTPGLSSSGVPTQQLDVPRDTGPVRLLLPLTAQRFPRYRAVLRPFAGGDDLWAHGALRAEADGKRLFVEVPAEILAPGDYELLLQGVRRDGGKETTGTFTFEITTR